MSTQEEVGGIAGLLLLSCCSFVHAFFVYRRVYIYAQQLMRTSCTSTSSAKAQPQYSFLLILFPLPAKEYVLSILHKTKPSVTSYCFEFVVFKSFHTLRRRRS
jgi:hypothetical protein